MNRRKNGSGIRGVRVVEIDVCDLDRAARFYTRVWHLDTVTADDRCVRLRGSGAYHHILALHQAPRAAIRRIVLDATDRGVVDRLYGSLSGITQAEAPASLAQPGGGYGFGFSDPEGRNFAVVCAVQDHGGEGNALPPDRPVKIAHVNVNATDHRPASDFLTDVLGFEQIDDTAGLVFFHCDSTDHAALVVAKNKNGPTLNHIAFELPTLDAVMRGAGRMRDAGYPIEWGVGRHGAGNNVFAYFAGPEELPLEYTSEVAQIDDGYRPGTPEKWAFPPGRTDQWGVTAAPSARLKRIQDMFTFAPGAFRLQP